MEKTKTLLGVSIGIVLGVAQVSAQAAVLGNGDLLTLAPGVPVFDLNGNQTNVSSGSWFAFDNNGNSAITGGEMTAMTPGLDGGIVFGTAQDSNGHASHSGAAHPGVGGIDGEHNYFGNAGFHITTSAVTQLSSTLAGGTLNLSGWNWPWNGVSSIPLGSNAWTPTAANCTALGITAANGFACAFANGSAQFTWDGVYGHAYSLWYTATVPAGDPSGIGGYMYMLHLEGTVQQAAAVPLPAAFWLFGSGLLGIAGLLRRRG